MSFPINADSERATLKRAIEWLDARIQSGDNGPCMELELAQSLLKVATRAWLLNEPLGEVKIDFVR